MVKCYTTKITHRTRKRVGDSVMSRLSCRHFWFYFGRAPEVVVRDNVLITGKNIFEQQVQEQVRNSTLDQTRPEQDAESFV